MTLIIGFGNKARHGKDTAAEAVVDYYTNRRIMQERSYGKASAPKAVRHGFADSLYKIAREEYGMKEKDSPLLQKIGNGRRVEFGLDYWIRQVEAKIKPQDDIVVVPDCRYKNEAQWIKSTGGYMVNITRLNADGTPFVDPSRDPNHISEVDLDDWNWDFKFVIGHGHQALTAELAITTAEYLRVLAKG